MSIVPAANPPNPWRTREVEWLTPPPGVALEVFDERAASILSENDSPDLGFRFSINPYRGCYHACAYCYARPTHEYLEFGAGSDFDRKIIAKINAPELLERAFERASWQGELVMFSGVTDCYQPIEASYQLTRQLLEVCLRYRNPVGIITKGALIRRDLDLLVELARVARLTVYLSVPFADAELARAIEPTAPPPAARIAALRALSEAGIETGIAFAPIIPGLNDHQITSVLTMARDAGARRAFHVLLRLPGAVERVFSERLAAAFPHRHARVFAALRDGRGFSSLSGAGIGKRFAGVGPRWQAIDELFTITCRRLGLAVRSVEAMHDEDCRVSTFRHPRRQLELFENS